MFTFVVSVVISPLRIMNYSVTKIETIIATEANEGYTALTIEGNSITEAMITKAFNETGADILIF